MIPVNILEDDDVIRKDDWCRPLILRIISDDRIEFTCPHTDKPTNNVKWRRVSLTIPFWIGVSVGKYHRKVGDSVRFEFIRGSIPEYHLYK